MLIRLRDLTTLSVEDIDGAQHRIIDLLVKRDAPDVSHIIVQLGSWLDRHMCAIRAEAFGTPDLSGDLWPAKVGESHIRENRQPVATICSTDEALTPEEVATADGTGPLASLSAIHEKAVEAPDGSAIGSVMDLVIDAEQHKIALLILHTGLIGLEHQRVVPFELVDHVDWDLGKVRLKCEAATVAGSPDLHEMTDQIEGRWYNKVLAYYGIG
ncbi:MAG: PRC-barrel domain-containing protein [Pseudomonadota bacterium]